MKLGINMEKVSVIIPTYNRCEKLKKSMDSVLQQTYQNIELIIVDDGSTDNTQEMIESIKDERIKYIKLPQNMGASNARNEGVRCANSEIIAFQDSDDVWKKDKLEKQMQYWAEHPEYSMIYCAFMYHKRGFSGRFPSENQDGLEGNVFPYILRKNTIGTPTMLFLKSCFWEVGGFDTNRKCLEDWEFALRFAEKYMIGYVDEVLLDVFFSDGSISTSIVEHIEAKCYIIAYYKKYLIQYNLFDLVVGELLQESAKMGILNEVKNMLSVYITTL